MKQNFDVTKYDAQIINYIKKTVHNTAINYFVKNSRIEEAEVISGQKFLDFLIEDKTFFVKEMIRVETDNLSFEFDNLDLATEFEKLNREEKSFL
ncbi:sigma-70 family RNA polymerase sigma factor, partial [Enterococcus faecalis]